jgi:hypothetical protein
MYSKHRNLRLRMQSGGVYVLRLANGALYVGESSNIAARIDHHDREPDNPWIRNSGGILYAETPQTTALPNRQLWEQQEFLFKVMKYGLDRVRGWECSQMTISRDQAITIKITLCGSFGLCRSCGHSGHFERHCSCSKTDLFVQLEKLIDACAGTKRLKTTDRLF